MLQYICAIHLALRYRRAVEVPGRLLDGSWGRKLREPTQVGKVGKQIAASRQADRQAGREANTGTQTDIGR